MKAMINKLRNILPVVILIISQPLTAQSFLHPGILHTESDFARMKEKVKQGVQPWKGSWDLLIASSEAQLTWTPRATGTVIRGGDGDNVAVLYKDVAAAYQHALIWKISGDSAHGDKSVEILNVWSATHTVLTGNADRYLASGLFGYQFANAAEIMRGYPGFEMERFQQYLLQVYYYPLVERFLLSNGYGSDHNDACITNYWANWDLCNMAAMLAIGVLCDNRKIYNDGIEYFKNGAGNGSIKHAIPFVHSDTLAQWQESGRDQGHSMLGVGLMASCCEIAWNQGDDLYSYDDNRFRKGAEYVAKYNLGYDVPFTKFTWGSGQNCDYNEHTVVSSSGRGELRPIFEMIFNHYANIAKQEVLIPNIAAYAASMRPEGGPGGHATTYDQPGFGSLTHSTEPGNYFYPWESIDIGNVPVKGMAEKEGDTIIMEGTGNGIDGSTDKFHFVFQPLIGNGEISARVISLENTNEWAKAGVMITENLDSSSVRIMMCVTAQHGTMFQYRTTSNDTTKKTLPEDGLTAPYWIRLVRSGDTLTGYSSTNGTDWDLAKSIVVDMNERTYAGLVVAGNNEDVLCSSKFDNVVFIQGNIPPVIMIESPVDSSDSYITGADIILEVYAYDYDDSISSVEFFLDENKLGEDHTCPYSYTFESAPEGSYTFNVKATDSQGAITSASVYVTVRAPGDKFPWYKFNETEGDSTIDANGFNLNAALKGGVTRVSGVLDMAMDFDGSNDYILLPEGVVSLLGDFTMATWVRPDILETWSRIFDFGTGTNNNMFLTTRSSTGKARFAIKPAGNSEQQLDANKAIPANKWSHVAVTLAGDTGIIYIDGVQAGINTEITFRPYNLGHTNLNYLGKSQWDDPFLDGKLDDFRIYNRALSPEEILALVNDPTINYPPEISLKSVNGTSFFPGDTIILLANASDVDSDIQLVEFYNGTTKLGEDSSVPYSIYWIGATLGSHRVKAIVTSSNGATVTSESIIITVYRETGIQYTSANNNIVFYPNPADKEVYLEGFSDGAVLLYDQSGKVIRRMHLNGTKNSFDLNGIKSGIYIIKFTNDSFTISHKLVVK